MTTIRLPAHEHPVVSVVIVTFGGWALLSQALQALRANTSGEYEIVIVDNASPDGTREKLNEDVRGATVILNDENVGFAVASNQGADAARGRFICFLNSDALVQPGWLDPLIETLEQDPSVGAVVPRLLNEDGTVQEAGSLIDAEGWALAYGGGEPSHLPEYRFRREVDFGSAACLLTSEGAFAATGGFDPRYGVGYYEDVDFCLKLRELGLRTMFEPRSEVVHIRFGSSTAEVARARMCDNRLLFLERWRGWLAARPQLTGLGGSPNRLIATRDAESADRLLVIDDRVPHVDRGSGDPRMAKLLLDVASLWPRMRITLAAADGRRAEEYSADLLEAGIEVVAGQDWNEWFRDRLFHYSIVLVSRAVNFEGFHRFVGETQPQALRIFDLEALSFRRLNRLSPLIENPSRAESIRAQAARTLEWEIRGLRESDLAFCVSPEEADFASRAAPDTKTFLLPSYVEAVSNAPGYADREDLLFFGGFMAGAGSPNEDALLHLVSDVMPLIWNQEPDVILHVVGADPTPAVRALDSSRVHVVGYVSDPNTWLLRTRLHIHPMRFGAGIKLKLLETMAAGLPLVTTPVGAEGLGVAAVQPQLVSTDPQEIARQSLALYQDRQRWEAAQEALLALVMTRFTRGAFCSTLAEAFSHAGVEYPSTIAVPSAT